MLYYAKIYSHLSYGLILWGNMISNTQLNTMQKLQNQAIGLVDSNQPIVETSYKTLGILKLNEAIKMENCKMMHKLEHNKLPGKLPLLFKTDNKGKSLQKTHKYNTRTRTFQIYPKPKLNCIKAASSPNALMTIRPYQKNLGKLQIVNYSLKSTKI